MYEVINNNDNYGNFKSRADAEAYINKQPLDVRLNLKIYNINNRKLLNINFIREKLLELGDKLVLPKYKSLWSTENPTAGYCYIVSEVIYHYTDIRFMPYSIKTPSCTHWYLKTEDNEVIDLTSEQFPYVLNYSKGKKKDWYKGEIKTDKGFISKRGYNLAKFLGVVEEV